MGGEKMMRSMLLVIAALMVAVGCGIPEEEHQAVLRDLAETKATLATTQDEAAQMEAQLRDDIAVLEGRIATLEKEKKVVEGQLAATEQKLGIFESEKGSLEERLKATGTELQKLREQQKMQQARLAEYRKIASRLQNMIDAGKLKVKLRDGKMVIELADNILFDPGKTDIKDAGEQALVQVAEVLKDINNRDFLIAGHTDNIPIRSSRFKSNWELSTARAVEVVKLLQQSGVNPDRLAAAGFGEWDPIASNEEPDSRALNRRIEIILMPNIQEIPALPKDLLGAKS